MPSYFFYMLDPLEKINDDNQTKKYLQPLSN